MEIKKFGSLLFCFTVLSLTGNFAQADPVSQVISFGDSNADAGVNAALSTSVLFGDPAPTIGSVGGRFSNGPVPVEDAASDLGVNLVSYGVGGATTGTYSFGVIPSLLTQIPMYQATLPSPSLDPNALYVITAGSNDLYGLTGRVPTATIETAMSNIETAVATLSDAGARNIIVVNRTVRPDPASQNDANGTTLNAALASTVSNLDASLDSEVLYLDAYGISSALQSNPSAYGLRGGSALCIEDPACISDPDGVGATYVRFDSAHLAQGANAIIAQEMVRLLVMQSAPSQIAFLPMLGVDLQRNNSTTALAAGAFTSSDPVGTVRSVVIAHYNAQRYDNSDSDTNADIAGLMVGAKYKVTDEWALGLLTGYDRIDVDREANHAGLDARQTYVYGTMQYESGPLSVDGVVGYGHADFRQITRESPIFATERINRGGTSGSNWGALVRASYDLYAAQGLRLGPMVQLDYWKSKLDGYTEKEGDSSALRFGDFDVSSSRLGVGPRLRYEFVSDGGNITNFEFSALYEHELASNEGKITTSSPRFSFISYSEKGREFDDDIVQLSAAAETDFGPVKAGLRLNTRIGDNSRSLNAAIGVSYNF